MTAQGPSADSTLDRTHAPAVIEAVDNIWFGWDHDDSTTVEATEAALRQTSSIVNALTGGHAYSVGLATGGTAYTDFDNRVVKVTGAALRDLRLSMAERLGVTSALAVHEAGHARLSGAISRAIQKHYGVRPMADRVLAQRFSNLIEDVRLEARTVETFPAFAGLFDLALWWVAQRYPAGSITRLPGSRDEAFSLALAANRYDLHTTWAADAALQAERTWWQDWAKRATSGKASDKSPHHLAAVAEALDRISGLPVEAPVVQPGTQPQPSEGDGDGEAGDEGDDEYDPDAPATIDEAGDEAQRADEQGDQRDEQGEADGSAEGEADGSAEAEGEGSEASPDAKPEGPAGKPSEGASQNPDTLKGADRPTETNSVEAETDRDALAEPLPAHVTDALTHDERTTDAAMASQIARTRAARGGMSENRVERLTVTHPDGSTATVDITDRVPTTPSADGAAFMAFASGTDPDNDGLNLRPSYSARPEVAVDMGAAAMVRAAFVQTRTHRTNRSIAASGSRLLDRKVAATAWGDPQVFVRRGAPSPDQLNVHLLIDASGSMHGANMTKAIRIGATLVEGLRRIPGTRVTVWSHNTASGADASVNLRLDTRRGDSVAKLASIGAGGANRDGTAIAALTQGRIIPGTEARERALLIVISDGAPCESESYVAGAVNTARKAGVGVISVAIDNGLTETQQQCYGRENVVEWKGNWMLATRTMAQIMGRLA